MLDSRVARKLAVRYSIVAASVFAALAAIATPAVAQRVLGIDISAHQGNILQVPDGNLTHSDWTTLRNTDNRGFAIIRSSRGGTTGYDHRQGAYPSGNSSAFNLSERYDDPYFVQNINLATKVGLYAGPYHRSRADIIESTPNSGGIRNTGTDDATHMMQMSGAWMRPGYIVPVLDFEDGDGARTDQQMAQFALEFSNRIYEVMQIRPAIYVNGNYAQNILAGGTQAQRDALAMPPVNAPSVVSPAFPTLWNARWPNQANPDSIDAQNLDPTVGFSNIYGPWDDYGTTHPWQFWQYASTARLFGYKNKTANIDVDVSHGDMEYLKDSLVPAVWWNDSSGDWGTMANWNSGQPVIPPLGPPTVPSCGACNSGTGQVAPIGTQVYPVARLPGTAGGGPAVTSGVNDTIILERPNANITVTLSTGSFNIRKMYMREALNITGGTLLINYNPNYSNDFDNNPSTNFPNALRSGSISAQFSGPVTVSGSGSLNVHTLQVDNTQTFTLAGSSGVLTFNTINLMPGATPAKIAMTGNVNILPLSGATATIANGAGGGSTGFIDLGGGNRSFNVANIAAAVALAVNVPLTNGALTKMGAGTMSLGAASTFAGDVTINGGVLRYGHSSGLPGTALVTVNNGGTLDMNNIGDTIAGLATAPGHTTGIVSRGTASLTLNAASGANAFGGTITGNGTFTKEGDSSQTLTGNNTLGPVNVFGGLLNLSGTNTTGAVTVNGGTLGGTGSVTGAVTVNTGGELAPGASIGTFSAGGLTFNLGSVFDVELGLPGIGDLANVSGLVTLAGGSVNITDAGGLGEGTYTLIDYGTLSGGVSDFESVTGPVGFVYTLVDSGSTIDLVVSLPIPEPSTLVLLILPTVGWIVRRRGR